MRKKIVLLYEDDCGRLLCEVASRVLTAVSLSFGHTFSVSVRCCRDEEIDDAALTVCSEADAVLAASDNMKCLDSLVAEMYCNCRVRDLRYGEMIENRALTGKDKDFCALIVQALEADEAALLEAGKQAAAIAKQETLPLRPVPPAGKLAEVWEKALAAAFAEQYVNAQGVSLPDVIPAVIAMPDEVGVLLCPPYAGMVLAPALKALCGAPAMCYDRYTGGQCPLYAALSASERTAGSEANPFGLIRAIEQLLREEFEMELEAGCVEAAMRNVLQAGWRSPDIAVTGYPQLGAEGMTELLCQQIEVAGEWAGKA
ncbi:MAG: hypothetical protein IKW00_09630 [Clostridia bacterium]|nr:hypothetical protein [Clostridia bacterium]